MFNIIKNKLLVLLPINKLRILGKVKFMLIVHLLKVIMIILLFLIILPPITKIIKVLTIVRAIRVIRLKKHHPCQSIMLINPQPQPQLLRPRVQMYGVICSQLQNQLLIIKTLTNLNKILMLLKMYFQVSRLPNNINNKIQYKIMQISFNFLRELHQLQLTHQTK